MGSPIQELFHLVAGKNSLPSKGSFKAFSIRTAITARFEGRERFLPNKGGGQSGTSRLVGKYLFISATKCSGESFCDCFSYSTQNGTGLEGEVPGVGGQDRVGSPCVDQEILRPICHIQLHPCLQPCDGYL